MCIMQCAIASTQLRNLLRMLVFGLCGVFPSTEREGLAYALYLAHSTYGIHTTTSTLQSILMDDSYHWVYTKTVSSENSRQALAQQLSVHCISSNFKAFKTSLKILSVKKNLMS